MIPNKSNFKFQELTPITGVKPYVIRFWETEFPEIAPIASEGGQKIYSRADVEVILKIKTLLFDEKLSIPEAKLKLANSAVDISDEFEEEIAGTSLRSLIMDSLGLIKEIKVKRNW
jgi:DNA-binding transcriptional MerR regulator